jgi:hypothetical protein
MTAQDFVMVAAIWGTYLSAALLITWAILRMTRQRVPKWIRRALACLVLAIFFAPSVIGAGHGGGFGPAWLALFQTYPLKLGVLPIAITFALFFSAGTLISWHRARPAP